MNNSTAFKQAHAMTKQVIKAGDNYQVTFGQCLKLVKAQQAAKNITNVSFFVMAFIVLALVKINNVLDIDNTVAGDAVFVGIMSGIALLTSLHLVNVFALLFTGNFLI